MSELEGTPSARSANGWTRLPVDLPQMEMAEHDCGYLPGRTARDRYFLTDRLSPEKYLALMDAGYRRAGLAVYQPNCAGCQSCIPVRVQVSGFRMGKTHRRIFRQNQDLLITLNRQPRFSSEKLQLYRKYKALWHKSDEPVDPQDLYLFLYASNVPTIEMEYRTAAGELLAVGICDLCPPVMSSVYFYFDPDHRGRSLGTFGVLSELEMCRRSGLAWYYLGYWVPNCPKMEYKSRYRPVQYLDVDQQWRPMADGASPILLGNEAENGTAGSNSAKRGKQEPG